jgi:hypothetical protein
MANGMGQSSALHHPLLRLLNGAHDPIQMVRKKGLKLKVESIVAVAAGVLHGASTNYIPLKQTFS